jgi:hypothetical protein
VALVVGIEGSEAPVLKVNALDDSIAELGVGVSRDLDLDH